MKNHYNHSIDLKKIELRNDTREEFADKLRAIEYRGYEVEHLRDGRKIVITKPGGKNTFGRPRKDDFLVYIFNPETSGLWQISHKQIFDDLYEKYKEDPVGTASLIELLERTFNGEEPDDFLEEIMSLRFESGENPEALVKVYKWIWGQEDVNYPNLQGRKMSWEKIDELRRQLK